jgi:ferredoxin-type protein NapH
MRQKIRNTIIWIVFLAFPLILNYFSPYLSINASWHGIVSGSLALFLLLFLSSLFLGRAFCGWVCPVGCFQDVCARINDRRRPKHHWIKFLIWIPWFSFIMMGFYRAGGIKKLNPLYMTENGISITEPLQFITYYLIVLIFLVLALAVGRHAFCHYGCWIAPFMMIGRKLRSLLNYPSLQLKANPEICIDCKTCTATCPMSIDVHGQVKKGDMEHSDCILCGQCSDGCRQNVISYSFASRKRRR